MGMFWRKVDREQPEAIISSAARLSMQGLRINRQLSDSEWQREAWLFYDSVPEFRFVCDWKSQAASRIRLFITTVDSSGVPDDNPTTEIPFAATFLGGPVAQSQLMADMVLQLEVVGQCFLVGRAIEGGEQWDVYSIEDLTDAGNGAFLVDNGLGEQELLEPASTVIIKVWRSHPRRKAEPNAPARAARAPLREIIRADQTIAAQMDSRLAGSGLLLLPKELSYTVSGGNQDDGPASNNGADEFMADLTNSMMTAIGDPNSVEAVVPIIVQGPGDELEKVRMLALSTPVSEGIGQARDTAVGRLARGLDIAAEVLLGLGDTNHLSGYQIEESNAKVHLAGPVELICAALTEQYLWPSIRHAIGDYRRYVVWYSLSELVQRPDRAADAQAVYDRGELSGQSLRRENGFNEADAPDETQRRRHDLLEVAGKVPVAAPAVVAELLRQMGIDVNLAPAGGTPANPDNAPAITATPAGPGGVGHGIEPDRTPQESRPLPATNPAPAPAPRTASARSRRRNAVTAAAEALTLSALETAGSRLAGRSRFQVADRQPWEYHTVPGVVCTPTMARRLLDGGALTKPLASCPTVAAANVDLELLTACLRGYCTELLCTGTPHESSKLAKALHAAELT